MISVLFLLQIKYFVCLFVCFLMLHLIDMMWISRHKEKWPEGVRLKLKNTSRSGRIYKLNGRIFRTCFCWLQVHKCHITECKSDGLLVYHILRMARGYYLKKTGVLRELSEIEAQQLPDIFLFFFFFYYRHRLICKYKF